MIRSDVGRLVEEWCMETPNGSLSNVARFIQRWFLGLLLTAYVAAALVPAPALWLRSVSLGEVTLIGEPVRLTLPLVLLAFLLLSAGLGVRTAQLRGLQRRPLVLGAGLAASVLVPLGLLCGLSVGLRSWPNPGEAQCVLVGLALVAAMPVAGSSAAWVHRTDGDLPLSLGLVLVSTLLSPWITPLALHAASVFTDAGYAEALSRLADSGTGAFLVVAVVVPSLVGVLGHATLGEVRIARVRSDIKLASTLVLLVLCYANAAVSLPQAAAELDWDFLALVLAAVVGVCVLMFAAGWALARILGADRAQRAALVYGLGMSNNGTGLVLAASALGGYPRALLPLILYNLVQHLVAGGVGATMKAPVRGKFQDGPSL
jgi:BASS family bile acid:Na+ symporter